MDEDFSVAIGSQRQAITHLAHITSRTIKIANDVRFLANADTTESEREILVRFITQDLEFIRNIISEARTMHKSSDTFFCKYYAEHFI